MMKKRSFILSLVLALGLALSFNSIAFSQGWEQPDDRTEKLTITSYYPSPYGIYRDLRVLDGQLRILSNVDPQLHIESRSGDAGIEIEANEGTPYIDFNDDGTIVRIYGDGNTLRIDGSLWVRDGMSGPGYLRVFKDGDEPVLPLPPPDPGNPNTPINPDITPVWW